MSDTNIIAQLASEAYGAFTTIERDGQTIVTLKDDRPEWVYDLAYDAHGEFAPDDWRYKSIRRALGAIGDDEPDNPEDYAHEWADGNVDTYTGARLAWLASNLNRPGYCDEAMEELGGAGQDIVAVIGLGQYMESLEIYASVVESLRARADEIGDA
jgi:hypothetical protein